MLFNPYYLLFLPAISGASRIPGLPASVNMKVMAYFCHSLRAKLTGSRAGEQLAPNTKFPEKSHL